MPSTNHDRSPRTTEETSSEAASAAAAAAAPAPVPTSVPGGILDGLKANEPFVDLFHNSCEVGCTEQEQMTWLVSKKFGAPTMSDPPDPRQADTSATSIQPEANIVSPIESPASDATSSSTQIK
mmetsp:Transcript_29675/g.64273  ORF Transcript_29675/g.64273 Transcript_29675/m.64273 type:complete len:124 (+) Transcript_29675:118-489(+)